MGFRIKPSEAPKPMPRGKVKKDSDYLAFLHKLPCCVTGVFHVEAAHVSFENSWYGAFGRGKSQKVADMFALPLCPWEHEAQHSGKFGGEKDYWRSRGVDPHQLAVTLWGIYCNYEPEDAEILCTSRIFEGIEFARLRLEGRAAMRKGEL